MSPFCSHSDLFLTSKLAPSDQGSEPAVKAIERSLDNLQTDYLDLYLIHWPGVSKLEVSDVKNKELRAQSWKVLEESHLKGQLRSIGVSNYDVRHLKELMSDCRIVPHVNQVEIHPFYQQRELVQFCRDNNVISNIMMYEFNFNR